MIDGVARWRVLASVMALALGACGGASSGERAAMPDVAATDRSADDMGLATADDDGAAETIGASQAPPPPPPILVVAGEHTAIEGPTPTLRITSPRDGTVVRRGSVMIQAELRDWELVSPQGPHVHLIVDDEPYMAIRDLSQPLDLNALMTQYLHHELSEGTHLIRMFPSRAHHESVKSEGAFATLVVHYRSRTEGFAFDPAAPLLTYSRPKGCNVLGSRVLLDFFVSHADLSPEGHRVRYVIDDGAASGDVTSWVPHWIENLPLGTHRIRLSLIGPDGQPVPGAFNDTTREITVAESCP